MGISNAQHEELEQGIPSVFVTNRIHAKRAFNKELGYLELMVRAVTAEARKYFMQELSTGCISYQSIELAVNKYCNDECNYGCHGVMIRELVLSAVRIALSEIDNQEREKKQQSNDTGKGR